MLAVLGAVVVLAALTGLAYSLGVGIADDDTGPQTKPPGDTSSTPAATGTGATVAGMEEFVETYLETVTKDPTEAFNLLTPTFQADSGGLAGYASFWDSVKKAKLLSIEADPDALTVGYDVEYDRGHGDKSSDRTSLRLEYDGGRYLIADEF